MLPDVALSLPCWLSKLNFSNLRQPTGQRQSNVRMQQNKFSIKPILFLHYEESLVVSSNLNSILFRFHCVRPTVHVLIYRILIYLIWCPLSSSESLFGPKKPYLYLIRLSTYCVATANLLGNLMLYSLFLPIYSVAHKNVVFISFHSLDAIVHDPENKI